MVGEAISWGATTIAVVEDRVSAREIIEKKIADPRRADSEDPFFVVDLGEVLTLLKKWKALLPRVKPFYAIKSNDNPVLVRLLERLGTGFDCASKGEMEAVLRLGIDPSRIIYANPYKQASHMRFSRNNRVELTVFNHEEELHKLKSLSPTSRLLLRILPESNLTFPHTKFGASVEEAGRLLGVARDLDLDVVGVSFHVGWHSASNNTYDRAVKLAKDVFQLAPDFGYQFSILDVGGGFQGRGKHFEQQAKLLSTALEQHFPKECGIEIIAEPGQFFSTTPFSLAVNIIAKQKTTEGFEYFVADGTFGSFLRTARARGNNVPWTVPTPFEPLRTQSSDEAVHPSVIWGRTCAVFDWIVKDYMLPEMKTGDWIIVRQKGDYSSSMATNFNGFNKAAFYYFVRRSHLQALESCGVFDPRKSPSEED